MMAADYRHIGGRENRLGRHYSRFSPFWPTPALSGQSLALRKLCDAGSNRRSQASLIRVVLEGSRAVATDAAPTGPAMPSFAWQLSDADVAAVVTYIRNAWGNAASAVSAREVANMRPTLHRDAQALSRDRTARHDQTP